MVEILQNFVAFSEYMNFTVANIHESQQKQHMKRDPFTHGFP